MKGEYNVKEITGFQKFGRRSIRDAFPIGVSHTIRILPGFVNQGNRSTRYQRLGTMTQVL